MSSPKIKIYCPHCSREKELILHTSSNVHKCIGCGHHIIVFKAIGVRDTDSIDKPDYQPLEEVRQG